MRVAYWRWNADSLGEAKPRTHPDEAETLVEQGRRAIDATLPQLRAM
jgi:hypothetical protein